MQSRRDQVQAHLFVVSRLAAGMLRAEPDAPDIPTGRTTRGIKTGLFLGIAVALGVGVYGMIKPGGATSWRKPGTMVVVEETGARFLYLDGALHPVLNQASAKLVAGDKMVVKQVSEKSLAGYPHGGPLGILGAPDALPSSADLSTEGWLACGIQVPTASGAPTPRLALSIGAHKKARPLTESQAALIAAPDGTQYLLWAGQRLRVDTANGALRALGYASETPYAVTTAYLNTLSAGPDLRAPDVPGRGSNGPALAGRPTKVGQLFTGPAGEQYLLSANGLTPLTTTLFDLLRGLPETQHDAYAGAPVVAEPIGAADLASHQVAAPAGWAGLPAEPPMITTAVRGQSLCTEVRSTSAGTLTVVVLVDAASVVGRTPTAQPGVTRACTEADLILVRPGGGALVRALSGGGAGTTEYLVTDDGVKYPLPSAAAAKKLGYSATRGVAVPDSLLTLLPTGPSLDPAVLAQGGVEGNVTEPTPPCAGTERGTGSLTSHTT